jgi:hypothetical protein
VAGLRYFRDWRGLDVGTLLIGTAFPLAAVVSSGIMGERLAGALPV